MSRKTQSELTDLQAFAIRIEQRILKSQKGTAAMENLVCRLMTNEKQPQIAARLAEKWVEWRFGKAPQPNTHANENGQPFKLIFEGPVEKD